MPRMNRRVPLDMYINKMIDGVPYLARTRDISREGVFVHQLLEPRAPEDVHIAVEFMLPGCDEVIWAEAEVIHGADGEGQGLRFRDLTPRQSRIIEDFVSNSSTC